LILYLDIINLFLYVLELVGSRRWFYIIADYQYQLSGIKLYNNNNNALWFTLKSV
jgi:hypothetical protein